ncbi:MAG TPA: hypothetical protein VKB88_07475 [Bryobacteraceae bacterium]|nr:hypothetical protein [Bryobacteraceae bacterium]
MARVRTVLGAIITAVRRDLKTVGSFAGNNLFVAGVTFLFLKDSQVFVALTAFIGLVLFIPLSADPLRVLPRDRLAVWPLSPGERRLLRIVSPWLNPVMWLVVGLALWKRVSMGVAGVAGGVFAVGFVLPSLPAAHHGVWRRLPHFPGPLNQLVRKNLRETLSTLDFWCSAVVSSFCLGYRAAGLLPAEALLPMTILTLLALSTYSQTLFGLDGDGGLTRYRLLPVRGWQILAAKDVPFLLAAILVSLPLAPAAGAAGALCALAMGHHSSVAHHSDQVRWRFSSGVSFGASLLEIIIMTAAAAMVHALPPLLVVCAGFYLWSVWWFGRMLEQQPL